LLSSVLALAPILSNKNAATIPKSRKNVPTSANA
jgi:hypothetical protein